MIDFHLIFATSLFIFAMNYLLVKDNQTPFSWVDELVGYLLPTFIKKPLYSCPICMASFYGTMAYWINTNEITIETILNWVVTVIIIAGLNRLLLTFIH